MDIFQTEADVPAHSRMLHDFWAESVVRYGTALISVYRLRMQVSIKCSIKAVIKGSSAYMKEKVECARAWQAERFAKENIYFNAQMSAMQLEKYCRLGEKNRSLWKKSMINSTLHQEDITRF